MTSLLDSLFAALAVGLVVSPANFLGMEAAARAFGTPAGGLAENASVAPGFQLLLRVAVGFSVLSPALENRHLPGDLPNRATETGV